MPELTDHQKSLLARGLSRGEHVEGNTYVNTLLMSEDAYRLYCSASAGHESLITLEFLGFIETTDTPGRFRIVKAPPECELKADSLRKKRKEKEAELNADME